MLLEEYKKDKLWKENADKVNIRSDVLVSKRVKSILQKTKNKKILDLGCGNGKFARMIAKNNKVVGLDVVKEQIEIAKAIEEKQRKGIKYFVGDILKYNNKLPYKKFDIVLMLMVSLYFDEKEFVESLKIANKYLIKNGKIIYANIHSNRDEAKQEGIKLITLKTKLDNSKTQQLKAKIYSNNKLLSTTTYFKHPLDFVISSFAKADFNIKKTYEPKVTEREVIKYPNLFSDKHTVDYLIIEARKEKTAPPKAEKKKGGLKNRAAGAKKKKSAKLAFPQFRQKRN